MKRHTYTTDDWNSVPWRPVQSADIGRDASMPDAWRPVHAYSWLNPGNAQSTISDSNDGERDGPYSPRGRSRRRELPICLRQLHLSRAGPTDLQSMTQCEETAHSRCNRALDSSTHLPTFLSGVSHSTVPLFA